LNILCEVKQRTKNGSTIETSHFYMLAREMGNNFFISETKSYKNLQNIFNLYNGFIHSILKIFRRLEVYIIWYYLLI